MHWANCTSSGGDKRRRVDRIAHATGVAEVAFDAHGTQQELAELNGPPGRHCQ